MAEQIDALWSHLALRQSNNLENQNKPTLNTNRIFGTSLVIVLIIVLFILFIDFEVVIREIRDANPILLVGASAMLIFGLTAYAARWRALLQKKPTLLFTFHASNAGHAGNILLPFRAGEPLRILIMGTNENVSLTESTSSFVVERLFEQLMRFTAFGIAIIAGLGLKLSTGSIIGGVAFLVFGFGAIGWLANNQEFSLRMGTRLLAKIPRVSEERAGQVIYDLLENIRGVSEPREFLTVLFWSFSSWGFFWAFFYLTLLSIGDAIPPDSLLSISLGALALSPPSAPTQPGIFHASIVIPLAALGFEANKLTAYAVILHILEIIVITALGIWGLFATGFSWQAIRELFNSEP